MDKMQTHNTVKHRKQKMVSVNKGDLIEIWTKYDWRSRHKLGDTTKNKSRHPDDTKMKSSNGSRVQHENTPAQDDAHVQNTSRDGA